MLSDFPRGGKLSEPRKSAIKNKFSVEEDLFEPKKKKQKTKNCKNDEDFTLNSVKNLSYMTINEGMIILGQVLLSSDYFLTVSLPGGVKGEIQATDISDKYTDLLQQIVNEDDVPDGFQPLSFLFKKGDYLVCYVKEKIISDKIDIALSIEPQLINENLDYTKLQNGSKLVCSISSIEDHGYVVDTGIKNLRGFLSTLNVDKDIEYYPGQQIFCDVKSYNTEENITTVKLSANIKHFKNPITQDNQLLDAFIPGSRFNLMVNKILSNGLQVTFNNNQLGYISQIHLNKPIDNFKEDTNIVGTLLYVTKTIKFAYFSLLSFDKNDNSEKDTIKIGSVIDNAKVLFHDGKGIILQLTDKHRGYIKIKNNNHDIRSKFSLDSLHTCKILSYNNFDKIYTCSTKDDVLDESFIVDNNVKPGDVLTVTVNNFDSEKKTFLVNCKTIKGKISSLFNKPEEMAKINIGDKIEARVLHANDLGNRWNFSINKKLIRDKLPILCNYEDAEVENKHTGIVFKKVKSGIIVMFFNHVKGFIPKTYLKMNYSVGDVVSVVIKSIQDFKENKRITLKITDSNPNEINRINNNVEELEIGDTVKGVVTDSSSEGVYLKIENIGEDKIGFIPAGHMAPSQQIGSYLSTKYRPGDNLTALVFSLVPKFLLSRTFVAQEKYSDFNNLKTDDCIPCSIDSINKNNSLNLILPIKNYDKFGKVVIVDTSKLHTHQLLFGKITRINKKTKEIYLSTILKDVNTKNDSAFISTVDYLAMYFEKYQELSTLNCLKNTSMNDLQLGQQVSGSVDKILDYGIVLKLNNGLSAIVRPAHYLIKYKEGDEVVGNVLWIDHINNLVEVTLKSLYTKFINSEQNDLPEDLKDTKLMGTVVFVNDWFILVVLKKKAEGTLVALPIKTHVNDVDPHVDNRIIGKEVSCYLVMTKSQTDVLPICLTKFDYEKYKNIKVKNEKIFKKVKTSGRKKKNKQDNQDANDNDDNNNDDDDDNQVLCIEKPLIKKQIPVINLENPKLSIPDVGFIWNPEEIEAENEESSSESEDEEEDQQKIKNKKLSRAEKKELERQKERTIREKEEALARNDKPNSVDQFDRLVLGSPDSSIIWIQYMVYHLQATEIDKARTVAKRALKVINFREEQERLNVWQAWLNLESRFGTPETLNKVFHEAVQGNDSYKIYHHMLTVHYDAGRHSEVEKTINVICSKFKQEPEAWTECGSMFLRMGLKDKSRHLMQRALQTLPPAKHVNLMVKFAQLENNFGDKERCQTLFDQILTSYPKRVDVWSFYVDCLVKGGSIKEARQVLEKAVVQNLKAKKMKSLFQKFINFEEKHGDKERVEYARQLAVKYVENQCK